MVDCGVVGKATACGASNLKWVPLHFLTALFPIRLPPNLSGKKKEDLGLCTYMGPRRSSWLGLGLVQFQP